MPEVPKFSAKRALVPSEISSRPWQTVSADLFYAQQSWFLIVVDNYAKFPFVRKLSNLTTGAVVKEIKTIFAENGIPETLQCDNSTQFTSVEFHQLASQYGFEIITSSSHYPPLRWPWICRSSSPNGEEVYPKVFREDINLALLALRTTPLSPNIASPAERLSGRIFKSTLPGKIYPSKDQEDFRNWLRARQDNQSHFYNRNTKELPELYKGQAIYVQDLERKTWSPA